MAADDLYFEKSRGGNGDWYWRLKARNGRTIADSAEGYKNGADCDHGIDLVRSTGPDTPVRTVSPGSRGGGMLTGLPDR